MKLRTYPYFLLVFVLFSIATAPTHGQPTIETAFFQAFLIKNDSVRRYVSKSLQFDYQKVSQSPHVKALDPSKLMATDSRYFVVFYFFDADSNLIEIERTGYDKVYLDVVYNSHRNGNTRRKHKQLTILSTKDKYAGCIALDALDRIYRPHPLTIQLRKKSGHQLELVSDQLNYASYPYDLDKESALETWLNVYHPPNDTPILETYLHEMVRANYHSMYVGVPYFNYFKPKPSPRLEDNEGGNPFPFLLEGNLSMPFTLIEGRKDQSRFLRSFSVSLDPEFTWRVTTDKTSAPILPLNTKVGFSFNKSFIANKAFRYNKEDLAKPIKLDSIKNLSAWQLSAQLMHSSNGQDEGVWTDSTESRIDYRTGNFSTNFLKIGLNYNSLSSNYQLWSFGVAASLHGRLLIAEFEETQASRYGRLHLHNFIQWRSKPKYFRNARSSSLDSLGLVKVTVPAFIEHVIRLDSDIAFFNVNNYQRHLDGLSHSSRRFNIRLRYTVNFLRYKSTGIFAQAHFGRDYLNIRYHLFGYSLMAGVAYTLNKRTPKKWQYRKILEHAHKNYTSN